MFSEAPCTSFLWVTLDLFFGFVAHVSVRVWLGSGVWRPQHRNHLESCLLLPHLVLLFSCQSSYYVPDRMAGIVSVIQQGLMFTH